VAHRNAVSDKIDNLIQATTDEKKREGKQKDTATGVLSHESFCK